MIAVKQGKIAQVTRVVCAGNTPHAVRLAIANFPQEDNNEEYGFETILLKFSKSILSKHHINYLDLDHSCKLREDGLGHGILEPKDRYNVGDRKEFLVFGKEHIRNQAGYNALIDLDARRIDFFIPPEITTYDAYNRNEEGFVVGRWGSITRDNYLLT